MRALFKGIWLKQGFLAALLSVISQIFLPTFHVLQDSGSIESGTKYAEVERAGRLSSYPEWSGRMGHPHDLDHCSLCRAFCHPHSTWCEKSIRSLGLQISNPTPEGRTAKTQLLLSLGFSKARAPPSFS